MSRFDIISFGSAIVDILLKSADFELIEGRKGEIVLGQPYGAKIEIKKKVISSGGGGTNTAVAFRRLGLHSALVARLGQDLFGQLIVEELKKEGVVTDLLIRKKEETDISVILISPDGGRTILVSRGKTRLEIEDIAWSKLSSRWFYLASLEGNLDLVERLVDFAQERKIKIAWNPGKRELEQRERVIKLADRVDVFNLNREEMEELLGIGLTEEKFWSKVGKIKADLIIVTNGRQGAYLLSAEGMIFKPAPARKPIDETGAGDAFASGFVAGLIRGMTQEKAFDLAMRNAASVVEKIGAKAGLLRVID